MIKKLHKLRQIKKRLSVKWSVVMVQEEVPHVKEMVQRKKRVKHMRKKRKKMRMALWTEVETETETTVAETDKDGGEKFNWYFFNKYYISKSSSSSSLLLS